MKPHEFDPEARLEFIDAVWIHEEDRPGFGQLFSDAIFKGLDLIGRQPGIGFKIARTRCRQWIIPGFSFSLIYEEFEDKIYVWAVAHHKRRPGYWKYRLKKS